MGIGNYNFLTEAMFNHGEPDPRISDSVDMTLSQCLKTANVRFPLCVLGFSAYLDTDLALVSYCKNLFPPSKYPDVLVSRRNEIA